MMMRARLVLAFALLLLAPRGVMAQESDQDRAQALAEQATEQFGDGQYDEAAILFQQAYNLDPHPVILFNLARAHQEMGDLPTALQLFQTLVDAGASERAREAARNRMSEIRESLVRQGYDPDEVSATEYVPRGDLRIESEPPGAAVFVGNEFVGVTPHVESRLIAGDVRVRLELEGYHPIDATVAVATGTENTRSYNLAPRAGLDEYVPPTPGFLTVNAPAPGLSVMIDGNLRGMTPLEGVRLAPGTYTIAIRGEGWEPWTDDVTVETAGESSVFAPLRRVEGFDEQETRRTRNAGTALIAVGGAAIATGGVLGVMALGSASDYRGSRSDPDRGDLRDRARGQALGADLSFAAGAVAIGTGVALRVVAAKRRNRWSRDLLVMPSFSPRGNAALQISTRF